MIGYFINAGITWTSKGELICSPSYLISIDFKNQKQNNSLLLFVLVEILTVILLMLTYHQYGFSIRGWITTLLLCLLVIASFIDMNSMVIPDALNAFIGITGIIFIIMRWTIPLLQGFWGLLIGGGSFWIIAKLSLLVLKKEGMGGGDIKLAAVCGLYLGAEKMFFALIVTSYLAAVILLLLLILKKLNKDQYLPFGPYLAAGIAFSALFYEDFMRMYWRLILG